MFIIILSSVTWSLDTPSVKHCQSTDDCPALFVMRLFMVYICHPAAVQVTLSPHGFIIDSKKLFFGQKIIFWRRNSNSCWGPLLFLSWSSPYPLVSFLLSCVVKGKMWPFGILIATRIWNPECTCSVTFNARRLQTDERFPLTFASLPEYTNPG